MTAPTRFSDRAAALAFIAAQQEDPATACAYVDTLDQGLEADLDDLDQPWMETLRVVTDASGNLTGAVLVDWDEAADVSMGWVHGPWTTADTWQRDAGALLDAAIAQAPVARHQVYAATANTRLAELARSLGWRASATNHVLTIERAALARPDAGVRPATPDDLEGVAALHERAFPGTYASPAELVDPASRYRTMVLAEPAGAGEGEGDEAVHGRATSGNLGNVILGYVILGYVAGHTDDQGGYLDFVAVDPDARRRGIATRLIGAWADCLSVERLTPTVDDGAGEALALYARQGWTQRLATRGWTSPKAAEPPRGD